MPVKELFNKRLLLSAALCYLSVLLGCGTAALLITRGIIPVSATRACICVIWFLAVWIGAGNTLRGKSALPWSCVTAAVMIYGLIWLLGALIFDRVMWSENGMGITLSVAGGSLMAFLTAGKGGGGQRRKKRKAPHAARRRR